MVSVKTVSFTPGSSYRSLSGPGVCAAEICGLRRPHFGLIFRSFSSHSSHCAPQTIEKSSSNWHSPRSTHFYGTDPWPAVASIVGNRVHFFGGLRRIVDLVDEKQRKKGPISHKHRSSAASKQAEPPAFSITSKETSAKCSPGSHMVYFSASTMRGELHDDGRSALL